MRGENGDLYFSSGRKDKFAAENWLRMAGREGKKPKNFKAEGSPVLCDDQGCRGVIKGKKIAFARTPRGFYEDCDWADLMIAEFPLSQRFCEKRPMVLDLYDFLDNGAHAIYVRGDNIKVRTVKESEEDRPWADSLP